MISKVRFAVFPQIFYLVFLFVWVPSYLIFLNTDKNFNHFNECTYEGMSLQYTHYRYTHRFFNCESDKLGIVVQRSGFLFPYMWRVVGWWALSLGELGRERLTVEVFKNQGKLSFTLYLTSPQAGPVTEIWSEILDSWLREILVSL